MSKKFNIAVVGASGNVGRYILNILAERNFPFAKVEALASKNSAGKELTFGEDELLKVKELDSFDFSDTDIVFSSAGAAISEKFAPRATSAGALIIDNTSHFRNDDDIPLVIPEINWQAAKNWRNKNIIANPNCSTIQMLIALNPIHKLFKVKHINASTYNSTSGAGKAAMDELFNRTKSVFTMIESSQKVFSKEIAFNVIPQIDTFLENGETKEERKMRNETKKILDSNITLSAICARVPVFIGHGVATFVECHEEIDLVRLKSKMINQDGLSYVDGVNYITPKESAGYDEVFVSRLVKDSERNNCLSFFCASDNLRKGAALNAIQIAELLISKAWI